MSELFDDEDKGLIEEELQDTNEITLDEDDPIFDARRRLEKMLEEKRLRDELEDFLDY
jgi:hypothetical protein